MIVLASNNDIGDKLFAYIYDNFMFVADIIGNTKLPLTDFSIGYWLIFGVIVRLSIYAVNGTGTQYNEMAGELHTNAAYAYKKSVSGVKKSKNYISNKRTAKKQAAENAEQKASSARTKSQKIRARNQGGRSPRRTRRKR